jgi:magnesium chelatase family protein
VVLPRACAAEAAALTDVPVLAADSLPEVAAWLRGDHQLSRIDEPVVPGVEIDDIDMADVRGLEHVKLALEVAAAGSHNLLLIGSPGAGKSMLARRLPTILPPLDDSEALETSVVYSAAGKLQGAPRVRRRPFRSPHHEITPAAMLGGGYMPKPGEISLAHNGVLFLDEFPEFKRPVLEALREPLEEGVVTIVRARTAVRFPASFALAAAMNPCPCGYHGSSVRTCVCDLGAVRRYRNRLSGPLLDRIDLQVWVPQIPYGQLTSERAGEPSATVQARVVAARQRQQRRFAGTRLHANAQMRPRDLARWCALDEASHHTLGELARRRCLSARAVHRTIRVARTIADLDGSETVRRDHLLRAVDFRALDQEGT